MTATEPTTAPAVTGLNPQFDSAIQAMIAASGGKLYIESGYRSDDQQAQLFAAAVKKYGSEEAARKWVAPPGKSNHNKGLAIDLGGDIALAHQLAPQFGLVFPMSWEPWHIEPVHARESADPQAYTDPPPGEQNPTTDMSLAQQPDFQAASIAQALRGALDPTMMPGTTAETTGTPAATPTASTGGTGAVAPNDLYAALRKQGLPAEAAAAFVSIAGRESSYNPGAHNDDASTGDNSYGLFQVNLLNGGWGPFLQQHGMSDPAAQLQTLRGSVQAAKLLYDNSGLTPWGAYKGDPWSHGTDLQAGVDASGGEVSMDQLQSFNG